MKMTKVFYGIFLCMACVVVPLNGSSGYAQQALEKGRAYTKWATAPFRAGYGYSQKEKDEAQRVINELEQRKELATDSNIIQFLDDDIYRQKLITGEEMSLKKKILLGAGAIVLAGAVLATGVYYLLPQYLPDRNRPDIIARHPGKSVQQELVSSGSGCDQWQKYSGPWLYNKCWQEQAPELTESSKSASLWEQAVNSPFLYPYRRFAEMASEWWKKQPGIAVAGVTIADVQAGLRNPSAFSGTIDQLKQFIQDAILHGDDYDLRFGQQLLDKLVPKSNE